MKTINKVTVTNKINKLDFHDDAFTSLRIYPPSSLSNFARIDFEFRDDSTGAVKMLSFQSCANFHLVMDFDVLASNWHYGNTEATVAKADVSRMRKFVKTQMSHWRTTYMPPTPSNKPIRKKPNRFAATCCSVWHSSAAPPTSWRRTTG